MSTKNTFISVDEHVQEHPEVWSKRLSREKWGERVPHIGKNAGGKERWLIDGREIALDGVADCGAMMSQRTENPALRDSKTAKSLDDNAKPSFTVAAQNPASRSQTP